MEKTKTSKIGSKEEPQQSLRDHVSSDVLETSKCSDFKSLTQLTKQKIKRILSRYLPKDVIDVEKSSTGQLIKCLLKEKPTQYFILEKILRHLGCDVTICKLTKDELEELEQLLEVGSSAVGI